MLYATLRQRKLHVKNPTTVIQNGVGVDELILDMDDEWKTMDSIVCVFTTHYTQQEEKTETVEKEDGATEEVTTTVTVEKEINKEMLLTFGQPVLVPWECLEQTGRLSVSCTGYVGGEKVMTTMLPDSFWTVVQNGATTGDKPLDPTPTLYEQVAAAAGTANAVAQQLLEDKAKGVFNGPQGEKGEKGDKGDPGVTNAVIYDHQTLTEAQKAQARENISATGTDLLADGFSGFSVDDTYVTRLSAKCLEVQGNPKNETVYLADRRLDAQPKAYRVRFRAKADNATHSLILSFTEFVRGVGYTRTEKFFPLSKDWREYETTVIINEGRYSDYSHTVLTLYGRRVNDSPYMVISDLSMTELVESDFATHRELKDTVALASGFAQRMPLASGQFGISLKKTDGKSIVQAVMELPDCGFYTAYVQRGCPDNPVSPVNSSFRGFVHLTNNNSEYDYQPSSPQGTYGYIVLFDEVGDQYVQYIKNGVAQGWRTVIDALPVYNGEVE